MEQLIGATSQVIGHISVTRGSLLGGSRIIERSKKDGPDHCPMVVLRSSFTDQHNVERWRISFVWKNKLPPVWWGKRHQRLVQKYCARMYDRLADTAVSMTQGGVIGVGSKKVIL